MKKADYTSVISNTPITVAKFRVSRSPYWSIVRVGEILYSNPDWGHDTLFNEKHGNVGLTASYVEFIGYVQIRYKYLWPKVEELS